MVVAELPTNSPRLQVVVAVQMQLVLMRQQLQVEVVARENHQAFLVHLRHMLAVAVVVKVVQMQILLKEALVVVAMAAIIPPRQLRL
jgi:hypothetical protein